jgi:hypothetical protein
MNPPSRIVTPDQELGLARVHQRFVHVVAIAFSGAFIAGIVGTLSLMASLCFIAPSNRCFSISHDTLPAISLAVKLWWLPALIVAFLVATISKIRGSASWWSVLIAATISMLVDAMTHQVARTEMVIFVLFGSGALFAGIQLSRSINRLFGKRSI